MEVRCVDNERKFRKETSEWLELKRSEKSCEKSCEELKKAEKI
jgi:hypothetical protein